MRWWRRMLCSMHAETSNLAFHTALQVRESIRCVVVVNAIWKFRRDTRAAVAFIQITRTRNILIVLCKGAHRVQTCCWPIGIGRGFQLVAGGDNLDGRTGIGGRAVTMARINGKAISSPTNQGHGHGDALVEFGHQALRNAVVVISALRLHMRVVAVSAKSERILPQCFNAPCTCAAS